MTTHQTMGFCWAILLTRTQCAQFLLPLLHKLSFFQTSPKETWLEYISELSYVSFELTQHNTTQSNITLYTYEYWESRGRKWTILNGAYKNTYLERNILPGTYRSETGFPGIINCFTVQACWPQDWQGGITHWGWVMQLCVDDLTIIGSDNGLSSCRRQATVWTNA